jgi:hypothetical protein
MKALNRSSVRLWTGQFLLEHCPFERPGCEERGCRPAAMCRAARARLESSLWEGLEAERREEALTHLILVTGGAALIALAFLWPYLAR